MKITTLGIDLAKNVFHVHGDNYLDRGGQYSIPMVGQISMPLYNKHRIQVDKGLTIRLKLSAGHDNCQYLIYAGNNRKAHLWKC